jgi:hypothetical protein
MTDRFRSRLTRVTRNVFAPRASNRPMSVRSEHRLRPRGSAKAWLGGALVVIVAGTLGWSWIALAFSAATYPVTRAGEAANVVIDGPFAFVSLGERGLEIVDTASGKVLEVVSPPAGSESVDDLAIADHLLFALDAHPRGHLSVFSLARSPKLKLTSRPVEVPVGPFSGVAAGGGRVIVSGGTSLMSLRSYGSDGKLGPVLAETDCGRGQPDLLMTADGSRAFVSTHRWGPYFGLTSVLVSTSPPSLTKSGSLSLDTYGFTAGGAKPASFPLETALEGNVLYVATLGGLSVVSVADPDQPTLLTTLDVGVKGVNVDVRDHVAAVVGSSPQPLLVLIDVRSPSSPRVMRSIPLPDKSRPTGVAIGATNVIVAAGNHGVLRFPM